MSKHIQTLKKEEIKEIYVQKSYLKSELNNNIKIAFGNVLTRIQLF